MSIIVPKRFVGLHAHCGSSVFDGMGPPIDHFKACLEKGISAHAITDHGHMNAFASALLANEKLKKDGKKLKYIPGCEMYVHPSLEQWREDKYNSEQAKADAKEAKKLKKKASEGIKTNIERVTDGDDETTDVESSNAMTIENEDETRSNKSFNPVNRRHHLVVLPKSSAALKKIFHLVSRGYLEGFYRFPRVDLAMLKEAAKDDDILISTACLGGPLSYAVLSQLRYVEFDKMDAELLNDPSLLEKVVQEVANTFDGYADAVGIKNVLLELQFNRLPAQDVVNRGIIEFARRNGLTNQLVVTADSHYPTQNLWKHREMYKKLGYLNSGEYGPESLPKSPDDLKAELYVKNVDDVWGEYQKSKASAPFYDKQNLDQFVSDAIERSYDVAHETIGDISFDKSYKYPNSLTPADKTSFQYLVEMCKKGMISRGLATKPEYVARLKHELEVIKKMENSAYFVTLARALDLARTVCLLGVARGSSGGSLVAYVLKITDLDPIKYECRFDRFLNIHRQGAPDIDVDIGDRDAVIEVLRKEFGKNNVVPISNYNTFKVKTLVKDLSKFHGISFDEANIATRTVEEEVRKATMKHGDDKNLFVLTFDDAMQYSPSFKEFIDKYPVVQDSIKVLFKEQRSLGRHAGGVVIMDDAPHEMPLITSGGEAQTPWVEGVGGKYLEPLGYIKYDLLGLETMRLIARAIHLILQRKEGIKNPTFDDVKAWYETHLHPDVNNYDDQKVYEYVYHKGNFAGIFQLTSTGAQRLFRAAKPKNIVDIAVLTSIYRPGPLAASVDKLYLKARNGEEKFDWGHPLFEKVLGKTDNLLIFQEQVMDLAEHIAGFPKDQCDNVRRAIMKRDLSKGEAAKAEAKKMEDDFVTGAVKNGVDETTARKSYQQILWFAGYGFNRAHAVAYAIDSYMCAWLLTHYEEEWLCAYMESMLGNADNREQAFSEIKSVGYKITTLDINHALAGWTILPGKQFMPSFMTCKGIGESAIQEIVENRPYKDIYDLLWNEDGTWRHSKFNKKAMDSLIKVGAFGSMNLIGEGCPFSSYKQMHHVVIENQDQLKKSPKREPGYGRRVFEELLVSTREMEDWTSTEKLEFGQDLLGNFDINLILTPQRREMLETKGVRPIDTWDKKDIYWWIVTEAILKKTRNGKEYILAKVVGDSNKSFKMFFWGLKDLATLPVNTAYIASEVDRSDFGFSASHWKMRKL